MSKTWFELPCPDCGVPNWYCDYADPDDSSIEDIGIVTCWSCKKDISLFTGEFGEEYDPHMLREDEEVAYGRSIDGKDSPDPGWACPGCGRNEIHKMCPAWGTPFYMSGKLYTKEDEEQWRSTHLKAMEDSARRSLESNSNLDM